MNDGQYIDAALLTLSPPTLELIVQERALRFFIGHCPRLCVYPLSTWCNITWPNLPGLPPPYLHVIKYWSLEVVTAWEQSYIHPPKVYKVTATWYTYLVPLLWPECLWYRLHLQRPWSPLGGPLPIPLPPSSLYGWFEEGSSPHSSPMSRGSINDQGEEGGHISYLPLETRTLASMCCTVSLTHL